MSEIPAERRAAGYDETMEALRQAERELPDFTSSYDGEIRRLYEQIVTRPAFRYDPSGDALYRSYRDQAVSGGARAMQDTMGQAAALTGGYGSSYAQSAGQQQYGQYLERLGQVMPELYEAAYRRYQAQGDALDRRFQAARELAEDEIGRKRESYERGERERDRAESRYQSLVSLISKSGYKPSDEELARAGMNREQAEALRRDYLQRNPVALAMAGGWAAATAR